MSHSYITCCPRCGAKAFEKLKTYAHCLECLFVEDTYFDFETAYHHAVRVEKEVAKVIALPIKKQNKELL